MPVFVFEQKSLKNTFSDSLFLKKVGNPLRPELYLLAVGIALLVWLIPSLQRFFFHWPMCIGIGVTGLIVRGIERRKNPPIAAPVNLNAPPPPMVLQLLHDLTSGVFLVLPLIMAAAFVSPTTDLMISLFEEVAFPLLNFRAVTSVCCWLAYRFVYGR